MVRKLVGEVMVDSGQIFITDPCYLDEWVPGEYKPGKEPDNSYALVSTVTAEEAYGEAELGIAVQTNGDGMYPVYVTEDDTGNIVKVEIDLRLGICRGCGKVHTL